MRKHMGRHVKHHFFFLSPCGLQFLLEVSETRKKVKVYSTVHVFRSILYVPM
jgi:predicted aconitase